MILLRPLRIWWLALALLLGLWWDGQTWSYVGGVTPERQRSRQQRRARWLTQEFLGLGSAFIKLGQLLSARPDVLPADLVLHGHVSIPHAGRAESLNVAMAAAVLCFEVARRRRVGGGGA